MADFLLVIPYRMNHRLMVIQRLRENVITINWSMGGIQIWKRKRLVWSFGLTAAVSVTFWPGWVYLSLFGGRDVVIRRIKYAVVGNGWFLWIGLLFFVFKLLLEVVSIWDWQIILLSGVLCLKVSVGILVKYLVIIVCIMRVKRPEFTLLYILFKYIPTIISFIYPSLHILSKIISALFVTILATTLMPYGLIGRSRWV